MGQTRSQRHCGRCERARYLFVFSKAAARCSLTSGVEYYGTVVRGNRIVGSNPNLLQQLLAVAANCKRVANLSEPMFKVAAG